MNRMKSILALEDGTIINGLGFGECREVLGELVFNTSMTGYPEVLTDPSYNGQVLVLTYPLIGNYKIHEDWMESDRIWVEGLIVRDVCEKPSHWKGDKELDEFLKEFGIPGISNVDTRALTTKIREVGEMKCGLINYSGSEPDVEKLLMRIRESAPVSEVDLVSETNRDEVTIFNESGKLNVLIIDCGVKSSIIKSLIDRDLSVTVVPADTTCDEVKDFDPNGILISNGPGDPTVIKYVLETVEELIPDYPLMGICLGHQILALASGGDTYKLKFGHRGVNQPVKDLETGRVYITSQNHGFAVDRDSLGKTGFKVTEINCNDGTVEGINHEELPILSVQYHPEGSPGPLDNQYIFDKFAEMVSEYR